MQSFHVSVMSVMSVIKKSNNSEGQVKTLKCNVKYFQFANKESLLHSSRCFSFYQCVFFLVKRNFAKKG